VSAAADPRKDAVQSGVAPVIRGSLQTMYAYCEGPPSTPLIEAGRVLQRYAATSPTVLWAMFEVKAGRPIESGLFGQVERNRDCSVLNGCPLSGVIRRTYALWEFYRP
jgi:hypothetical protein